MNLSDVKDVELSTDEKSNCIKYYYLVSYDTSTGEWEIDSDSIYIPEYPIYDSKIDRCRNMHMEELNRDGELSKSLDRALSSIND